MPIIQQSQFCPFSPAAMYDLVNDIEQYPRFLPGCSDAKILSENDTSRSAILYIQKGPVNLSFSTRNQNVLHESISMELLNGPFHHLHGLWKFLAKEGGSEVVFRLDFELKGRLLQATLGPVFQKLADDMVGIFISQAHKKYGKSNA